MTIRLFVGCDPNHCDAESQSVLEWSVRKHASQPVEIEWMRLSKDPASFWFSDGKGGGWNTSQWATTFSAFRWGIPERCGFEGRAIYCDSDVIFQADIAELWAQPFPAGKCLLAKGGGSWRLCVSMWDCAPAKKFVLPIRDLRRLPNAHANMTYKLSASDVVAPFAGNWNCLDGEKYADLGAPDVKAIHYTGIGTQPQLRHAIPRLKAAGKEHWFNGKIEPHWRADLVALFDTLLDEAKENGYGPQRYLQEEPFGPVTKKDMSGYRNGMRR